MQHPNIQTLCLVITKGKILLGMKKRGFGAGRYNGFGGKINRGERPLAAAKREMEEETGVVVEKLKKCGVLIFLSVIRDPIVMHVYRVMDFTGTPQESEEMRPQWFNFNDIPYTRMWPDDEHWLPHVLVGKRVRAQFWFDAKDVIIKKKIRIVS